MVNKQEHVPGDLFEKRLALLHELLPAAGTVAYLENPANLTFSKTPWRVPLAAYALGAQVLELNASNTVEIKEAFAVLVRQHAGSLSVGPNSSWRNANSRLAGSTACNSSIVFQSGIRRNWRPGKLFGQFQSSLPSGRRLCWPILNGEKPASLPVQQATKFELVINLKTAKTLGLTVPPSLLALTS